MVKKICPICGKEYESNKATQKCCSRECLNLLHHFSYKHTCSGCGKVYYSNNHKHSLCGKCHHEIEKTKTTIEERIKLAHEKSIKLQYMKQYNQDHDCETLQNVKLVEFEVAQAYLQARQSMQVEEPKQEVIQVENNTQVEQLEKKVAELQSIISNMYDSFNKEITSLKTDSINTKSALFDIINKTGLLKV